MTDEILRISSRDLLLDSDDGPLIYRGDLAERQSFRFSRRVEFWPWGNSAGSVASGTLEVTNGDGSYDRLARFDIRNRRATLRAQIGDTLVDVATCIVDSVSADDDRSVSFRLLDPLARLDKPLQPEVFGGDADDAVIGRPLPTLIGVARSIPAILWDGNFAGGAFRVNYATLTGIGAVFDSGVQLDPTATPPQWDWDTRIQSAGYFLENATVGKIVCDASATGDGQIPVDATDLLSGRGVFDTAFDGADDPSSLATVPGDTTGMPEGWALTATISSQTDATQYAASYRAGGGGQPSHMRLTTAPRVLGSTYNGKLTAVFEDVGGTPFRLEAGKRYRWRFRLVTTFFGGWAGTVGGFYTVRKARLSLQAGRGDAAASLGNRIASWLSFTPGAEPGLRSGTFTCPTAWDGLPVAINIRGAAPDGLDAQGAIANITDIEFVEVPALDEIDLPGITLPNYVREVLRLSGRPEDDADLDSFSAIDATAASIGYWTGDQVQALSVLRVPMDSFGAALYTKRDGRIAATKLVDPETLPADFVVDPGNMASTPRITLDGAPRLTTRAEARRNYYQYSEVELAALIADLPLGERSKYTSAARHTVAATVPETLPEQYNHAVGADPLPTVYDDQAEALTEIQRVVDLYQELRLFVDVEIYVDDLTDLPDLGDIAFFQWDRFDFSEGRKMLVVGVTDEITGGERRYTATLRLWG